MNFDERKQAFIALGLFLKSYISDKKIGTTYIGGIDAFLLLDKAINYACIENIWFVAANVEQAIQANTTDMLDEEKLKLWLGHYRFMPDESDSKHKIGIIMAGNIPLVGFHDLLCVLLCGYCAVIKTSSKDNVLVHVLTDILCKIEPRFGELIVYTQQRPVDVDAVICTGSNNSARYFESWYGNIPHIIRKNRSSVAILTGEETTDDMQALGKDIFSYFGLGCRNVSSLLVPENYNFDRLISILSSYSFVANHKAYRDCYRYQKAVMDMENTWYYDTGFLLLKNSILLSAPIALVNYQKYTNLEYAKKIVQLLSNHLQCVAYQYDDVCNAVRFGQTQHPQLFDYADKIDTVNFLINN
ncbi:MAG: hypothetical protein LBL90_11255 [Prevotellaceae bacterium]|jgi:hypothetical protein|nr:hypothetical protein [Prevotellaceae bacterium]